MPWAFPASMRFAPAWHMKKQLSVFTRRSRSKLSAVVSSTSRRCTGATPALLTSTSSRPNFSCMPAKSASRSCALETSQRR